MTLLILASGSPTRYAMLAAAGLIFTQQSPGVDETPIKQAAQAAGSSPGTAATALARAKAEAVSRKHSGQSIIGADQILECDGVWFDKPNDRAAAGRQLSALRGRTHRLWTAAVVVADGALVWQHVASAELTMRSFSETFLDRYLDSVGPEILTSVGAYQLEGPGIQLFDAVNGDFFDILGLPLLPLLGYLRDAGVLTS